MPSDPFIALEIHDTSLWEPSRVLPLIEIMERWGYNALVLHQNDLLDVCTQLDLTANYGVSDLRLKKVRNACSWLNRLATRLEDIGAQLFLEIKEPSFHDYAVELFPDLIGTDGAPNLNNDVWPAFCRAKVEDLLDRVPGLGGLIVNLSSPESRVSMPDQVATNAAALDLGDWFDQMIAAFHTPLQAQGKSLWVRDFSYTADVQSGVLSAINRYGGAVGASVKITAHDYFPEFPENPGGALVDGPLIVEFDGFGEHTGWSVIPNCRVAEFRERMHSYRKWGASGCLMRISWEAISGLQAVDSLSAVNVFALPRLIAEDADAADLIRAWLSETYGLEGDLADRATDLMLRSWHIPAAAYWNGLVFTRHSCLPSTWAEGWQSMQTSGMGRRDREVLVDPDEPLLSDAAQELLFSAKAQATALARELAEAARALSPELPPALASEFQAFAWLPIFARQFELATKAAFHAVRGREADKAALPPLASDLETLALELEQQLAAAGDLPHHHRVLLDPEQVRRFAASLPI